MQPATTRPRANSARHSAILLAFATLLAAAPSASATLCGRWLIRQSTTAPSSRYAHAMTYDSDRAVSVLFGGLANGNPDGQTWEWDSTSWTLAQPAISPSPRYGHAMAYDSARGVTILFGGQDAANFNNDTWEWNGSIWTERTPSASPSPRSFHAMAFDSARGVTVLFGGMDSTSRNAETWEWDGANWLQRFPASAPSARQDHAMAYDPDRNITVLYGGDDGTTNGQTWEWNGTNWSQIIPIVDSFSGPLAPLVHHAMTYSITQHLAILDGVTSSNAKQLWGWNGSQWLWQGPVDNLIPSRTYSAITFDPFRARFVLFGGMASNSALNDTYEFDLYPITVSQQPADQAPCPSAPAHFTFIAAQQYNALTYQWRRGTTTLVNGGNISGANTSTLTINPVTAADAATNYNCVASCHCGSVTSNNAALRFNDSDCNTNGTIDSCEPGYRDCNTNSTFDICELPGHDCNSNGTLDACDFLALGGGSASNSIPSRIPDHALIISNITAAQQAFVTDVNVHVNIIHSHVADLTVALSRLNTTVTLAAHLGGAGANLQAVFDDQAAIPIIAAAPPYLGTFRPQNSLSQFNGLPKAGVWSLTINDSVTGNTGTLVSWSLSTTQFLLPDCNTDGILDACQLAGHDCNTNNTLDECEFDCNTNATPDACETLASDCNTNGSVDACEFDCNTNGVPDTCDPTLDCNTNNLLDACEFAAADCNTNGTLDPCELAGHDCNSNGLLDACEIDCDTNGTPDDCERAGRDCNTNSSLDVCELAGRDCDTDGVLDICELAGRDCDTNRLPDACELPGNDCNTNGTPDVCDLNAFASVVNSNSVPVPIPDVGVVNSTINVAQAAFVTDINVQINIVHNAVSELKLNLSHLGTTVLLISGSGIGVGVGGNSNFTNTVFDQQAGTSIFAGSPPYSDTYRPFGNLNDFNGLPTAGIWTLSVQDGYTDHTGSLLSWSLTASWRITPDCNTDGTPDICELTLSNDANSNNTLDICEALACPTCPGDLNADSHIDAEDIPGFVRCTLATPLPTDICSCSANLTPAQFIARLLQPGPTPCP